MTDEMTVEVRLILARYEDITDQYTARTSDIGEQFAQDLAKHDAEAAERARLAAERQPEVERAHEASRQEFLKAEPVVDKPPSWGPRQERPTTMSLGSEEFQDEQPSPPVPATPPQLSQPVPVPPRGVPRPAPAADEPEDDDWSGRNWLR